MSNDLTERSDNKIVNMETWNTLMAQGTELIKSGFLPSSIKTPAQAIAVILTGRELGIGIMEAMRGIDIIEGKPAIKPQLMLSLIHNSRVLEDFVINSQPTYCEVTMTRKGMSAVRTKFGDTEAAAMNLLYKDNYKKQKQNMYRWRAISACARLACPDVIGGLYTPEELENSDDVVGKDVATLELSEKLNADPDAYTKWCETTTTQILDEIGACENDKALSQIRRSHEKDIGQMMDEDRGYINEMFDSRLQQLVMDSEHEGGSILKDSVKEAVIGPNAKSQGTKPTVEEELAAQEAHSQAFGQEYVVKINACTTKAQLNLIKASNGFITGRAKCNVVMKDYVDAVLQAKYGKFN